MVILEVSDRGGNNLLTRGTELSVLPKDVSRQSSQREKQRREVKQTWPGWVVTRWPSFAITLPASARAPEANGLSSYPCTAWLAKGHMSELSLINLMPYLSFHRTIFTMSRMFAKHSPCTNFSPRATSGFVLLSGLFVIECSGFEGSLRAWRWLMMEASRHVRELKMGGLAERRYVFKQAYSAVSNSGARWAVGERAGKASLNISWKEPTYPKRPSQGSGR